MAAEDIAEDDNAEQPEPGGGKKRIILWSLLVVLVIVLSVGGTLLAVHLLSAPDEEELAAAAEAQTPLPQPAIYYPLKPPIIVNFSVKGRQRFLQAELVLMTRENDVISAVELHQSMIRNALVMLIGGQVFSEIQTAEGKELLRQQCLQEIQRLLEQEIGKPGIEQVLFSNFVMQ